MAAPYQDCVILLGDSITQMQDMPGTMQNRFSDAYRRSLDVLNRGFSGYNTRWARELWDTMFAKKGTPNAQVVRLVTIWFGANDAVFKESMQAVPLEEYKAHLRFFLESLTATDSPYAVAHEPGLNIVLITPPPLNLKQMEGSPWPIDRHPDITKKYTDAVLELGEEYKAKETLEGNWRIGTINLWDRILEKAGKENEDLTVSLPMYLTDGLHLTNEGYAVMWDEYTKLVKNEFKGRGLDWEDMTDLPRRVPEWDAVDPNDVSTVLAGLRLPPIRMLN